jgi:Lrp/AsnC ligand binding domain
MNEHGKRNKSKYYSLLLADIIFFPEKPLSWHAKREHGFSRPNEAVDFFKKNRMIVDAHPNFYNFGFISQAFVDIIIDKRADSNKIKAELHKVHGVIMIYTVFGTIDIKCKVVGIDLRSIEDASLQIRKIDGVSSVTTSIVIDESNYDMMRKNWSEMIRYNKDKVNLLIEKSLKDIENDYGIDDGGD